MGAIRHVGYLLVGLLAVASPALRAQPLPLQVGPVNDYAAALGGAPQRAPLQELVAQLDARHGVSLTVLVSERDPFGDPDRYAAEVRAHWKLPTRASALAVFLRQGRGWAARLWLSADLSAALGEGRVRGWRAEVERLAGRNRIREAALASAQGLLDALAPDTEAADEGGGPNWLLWGGGTLGALALGGVGHRLRTLCPRCARRLQTSIRYGKRLKRCAHCGYNR